MPDIGHLLVQIGAFAMIALPLLMFALIIYLLWRTLQVMPRVGPKSANTTSESSVSWDEVAGLEEARDEMQEIVDFLKDSKRFAKLGAGSSEKAFGTAGGFECQFGGALEKRGSGS